jgi:nitronate monooxygenase
MTLPASLAQGLRLPPIAAPMLRVSGVELVSAACCAGVIGAFPTVNARSSQELHAWLARITADRDCVERPTVRPAPTSSCGATPTPSPRTCTCWCAIM